MQYFGQMIQIQSTLFIYMACGFFLRKKEIITAAGVGSLSAVVLNVALPAMIFSSFDMDLNVETMGSAGLILLISTLICLISMPIGRLLYRKIPTGEKRVMLYGTLVSNAAYAGLPLVSAAFGQEALFLASIYLIPLRILMWSAGISLFTDEKKGVIKKVLVNPGIIAVALGLFRMLIRLELPWFLDHAIDGLGTMATPLSLFMVGAILGEVRVRTIIEKNVLFLTFIRLIGMPILVLICLKLLKADFMMTAISVTLVGMPVGANTTLLAKKYGADHQFASKCTFVSTALSLITAPLLTLLL